MELQAFLTKHNMSRVEFAKHANIWDIELTKYHKGRCSKKVQRKVEETIAFWEE